METLTIIILGTVAILVVLGITITWLYSSGSKKKVRRRMTTIIALVVTMIWMAAMVADILITGYSISPVLHAIMGAIVGYFFTQDQLTLSFGGDSNDEKED